MNKKILKKVVKGGVVLLASNAFANFVFDMGKGSMLGVLMSTDDNAKNVYEILKEGASSPARNFVRRSQLKFITSHAKWKYEQCTKERG